MRGAPTDEAFEALCAQLGGTAPNGLKQLESEQLARLTESIRAASLPADERQDIARRAEIEGALERLGRLGEALAQA